jgi:hypothetical protein
VSVLPEDKVSKLKRENKKAKSEALELLAATRKSSKSVQFANFNDSHECDQSAEEALCTWLSVSCSMVLVLMLYALNSHGSCLESTRLSRLWCCE